MFGGDYGERIGSLRSIKGYRDRLPWYGPCGLEFIYQGHDNLLWGSRCERMSSIDLDKGEYIERIQIDDMRTLPRPMTLMVGCCLCSCSHEEKMRSVWDIP